MSLGEKTDIDIGLHDAQFTSVSFRKYYKYNIILKYKPMWHLIPNVFLKIRHHGVIARMSVLQSDILVRFSTEPLILIQILELGVCLFCVYCPMLSLAMTLYSVDHRFREAHSCSLCSKVLWRTSHPGHWCVNPWGWKSYKKEDKLKKNYPFDAFLFF